MPQTAAKREQDLASDQRAGSWARASARNRQRSFVRRNGMPLVVISTVMLGAFGLLSLLLPGGFQRGFLAGVGVTSTLAFLYTFVLLFSGTGSTIMGDLATARVLATSHFPDSLVADVLLAAGLDPEQALGADERLQVIVETRRRSASWRAAVIEAWDRRCAFCGYDGQLAGAPVGLDAAHVRWFSFEGPDELDNGLALCSLHHKLFDRGVIGLDESSTLRVSGTFTARSPAGRVVYDLHGRALAPRPGTDLPDVTHIRWHTIEVFKGLALTR